MKDLVETLLASRGRDCTATAVKVKGDGNCLFRALSLRRFGTEDRYNEIRYETVKLFLNQFTDLGKNVFTETYHIGGPDPQNRIPELNEQYFIFQILTILGV